MFKIETNTDAHTMLLLVATIVTIFTVCELGEFSYWLFTIAVSM